MKHTVLVLFTLLMVLSSSLRAQDSLTVTPSRLEAGKASIYELSFVTTDTLNADGQISVTFPQGIDLSDLKIASSITINGGFKVRVAGQQVFLTRTGLGRVILPSEKVAIKFGIVRNPIQGDRPFSFQIEFDHRTTQPVSISRRRKQLNVVFKPKAK